MNKFWFAVAQIAIQALAGNFTARVDWLERILFGLCGAAGTLLLGWISLKIAV